MRKLGVVSFTVTWRLFRRHRYFTTVF